MENLYRNIIFCGDAAKELQRVSTESVDCIVTSPPYYNQRDYKEEGQLGSENSPADYILAIRKVFRECFRVLKPSGTLWLNLGDKYENGRLLGMPWRVALAMQDDGWILRSDIIWHKPNAMPSSVKNRPTTDHEYLFLLTKSAHYYYDIDAIREPHVTFSENSKMKGGRNHFGKAGGTPEKGKNAGNQNLHHGNWDIAFHPLGRNKRTVWSIGLGKYRGAHFAVFPEKLVEPCILAGCPSNGVVLDPFMGSGTVALVTKNLGRDFLGIEINADYIKLAQQRLSKAQFELFDMTMQSPEKLRPTDQAHEKAVASLIQSDLD